MGSHAYRFTFSTDMFYWTTSLNIKNLSSERWFEVFLSVFPWYLNIFTVKILTKIKTKNISIQNYNLISQIEWLLFLITGKMAELPEWCSEHADVFYRIKQLRKWNSQYVISKLKGEIMWNGSCILNKQSFHFGEKKSFYCLSGVSECFRGRIFEFSLTGTFTVR